MRLLHKQAHWNLVKLQFLSLVSLSISVLSILSALCYLFFSHSTSFSLFIISLPPFSVPPSSISSDLFLAGTVVWLSNLTSARMGQILRWSCLYLAVNAEREKGGNDAWQGGEFFQCMLSVRGFSVSAKACASVVSLHVRANEKWCLCGLCCSPIRLMACHCSCGFPW